MAEANIANEMYDLDPVAFEPHWRFIRALVWDIVPDEHGKLRKFDIRSPRDRRVVFSWWLARLYEDSTKDRFPTEDRELHRKLDEVLLVNSAGRKFFSMEVCLDRVFGWGPKLMQQDDLVYQFPTSETPFILRERGHGRVLIGDCFVLGHMGDVSLLRDRNMEFRTFLNEGVEDLLWLRGICDTSDATYIDEVMRHIGQAVDDLTVEFVTAHDRKRNENGAIVMKAKDIY
ncbi:hypothetical protein Micbo1qcDRAFT_210257 [Microdochium bolleyi]|uniref:Uncharacterized protein n=1 Tax=Microdochium bolleyi TaxID=196109 RepID=A0A136IJD4_9PEZI|nr:hypothetical protein Micbo1qcDRAFT_210257 [Microdochium bolleyi]